MRPQALFPILNTDNYALASTFEQLLFHARRSAGTEVQLRLSFLSRYVRRSTSALSRYLQWLHDQGFIRLRRVWKGSACILYARVLLRLKPGWDGEAEAPPCDHKRAWDGDGTAMGRRWDGIHKGNTRKETQGNQEGDSPERAVAGGAGVAGKVKMVLKPLEGVRDRIREKREHSRARAREAAPKPTTFAHEWVRLLAEYGYLGFDPADPKHLSHIKRTIALFGLEDTPALIAELERRIAMWKQIRPAGLGKAPPHPWAINRTDLLFKADAALAVDADTPEPEDDLTVSKLPKAALYAPPPAPAPLVDKPQDAIAAPAPMLKSKTNGILDKLKGKPKE